MNILLCSLLILFLADLIRQRRGQMIDQFLFSQNLWFRWAVMIGMFLMVLTFGEYGPSFDAKQFIYFQF